MNDQHVSRLEAQLERLVESTFTHLFGKRVKAQDIALQLARAMEDFAQADERRDERMVAPDHYTIFMSSSMQQLFLNQPDLPHHLSNYLVEMAMNAGYRLNMPPLVEILPNDSLPLGTVSVAAKHRSRKNSTTAVMKRVEITTDYDVPQNPQILLQGQPAIALTSDVINIGRSRDNHIVIDDRSVSRYHLQLRLRFGRYNPFRYAKSIWHNGQ